MRTLLLSIILLLTENISAQIDIRTIYSGLPIYFRTDNWTDSCKRTILINNKLIPDTFPQALVKLDNSLINLNNGDTLHIKVFSNSPYFNNHIIETDSLPNHISPNITIQSNCNGKLIWTSYSTKDTLPFCLKSFRWNRWVVIEQIPKNPKPGFHTYETTLLLHPGENKFQLEYSCGSALNRVSFSAFSPITEIDHPVFDGDSITLERTTFYMIVDSSGTIFKSGNATKIFIGDLRKGHYFLLFENTSLPFSHR